MSNEVITVEQGNKQVSVPQVNPMQLVSMAVEQGADLDKLSKLMDLQERWEAGQAKKAFDEAMNSFQSRMPVVPRRGKVDYTTQKGRTNYDYGRLEDAFAMASPILKDCGLSFRFKQENNGNMITVTCIISHKLGHYESNSMSAMPDQSGNKDAIKAMASTNSYLRRYTFTGGLGIIFAGEDDEIITQQNKPSDYEDPTAIIVNCAKAKGRTDQQLFHWLSQIYKREIQSFDEMSYKELQDSARKLEAQA
jgi:hypothetical protein